MSQLDPNQLKDLLARCALKDQKAFEQLYALCASRLNGIAWRVVRNSEVSNEILQEALIQIWHKAGEYRCDLAEPMTWMASIVRYRAYDRVKYESRRIEGAQIKDDLMEFDVIEDLQSTSATDFCDISGQLEACLKGLEGLQRKAILMAYYYGYSRDELAEEFQTPLNTIKSWLRRGLTKLQVCLEE